MEYKVTTEYYKELKKLGDAAIAHTEGKCSREKLDEVLKTYKIAEKAMMDFDFTEEVNNCGK